MVSPDGTFLVYRTLVRRPAMGWDLAPAAVDSEVVVAPVDGSVEPRNISRNLAFDGWPNWSPDGEWIVFGSNRLGPARVAQLFVVRPDGTGLRRVTSGPWGYAQPTWTADGRWIHAYQFHETSEYEYGDVVAVRAPMGGGVR